MEFDQNRALYRCACGWGPGRWAQVNGHRGQKKSKECAQPAVIVLDDDLAAELVADFQATAADEDLAGDGEEESSAEAESLELAKPGRRNASRVADPNARANQTANGSVPSSVRHQLDIPVYFFGMYDAWRRNWRYAGSFNEFIIETCMDHWEQMGVELILARLEAAREAVTAPPNGNGHVATTEVNGHGR